MHYNILSMPNRKRKRKVDPGRLAVVGGVAIVIIALLNAGLFKGGSWIYSKFQGEDAILLADGSELEEVDPLVLKNRIDDVFKLSSLASLKEDVQTYMFNNELNDLKEQILNYLEENNVDQTKIAWAIQDLTTDAYIESDNASTNFTAASTYKLPLVMLWYDKVANGEVSMDSTYIFTENMKEEEDYENPSQPIVRKFRVGDSVTLAQLLSAAALYSDNVAGHMLFENLGGYSAYKQMALKYSDDPQDKDFTSSSVNVLNPNYTMDLVYTLYHDSGTYDELKYWLYKAAPGMFLNKNVNRGYIQKVGNIDEVRNVIGYLPGEFPYSVSIYSCIDKEQGEQIIADIGDICYNYFMNRYYSGDYDNYPLEERIYTGQVTVTPEYPLASVPDLPEDEIEANIIRSSNAD